MAFALVLVFLVCHSAAQRRNLLFRCGYNLLMLRREYQFYVYIIGSRSRHLYIGFTNNLLRRMQEHRDHRPGAYSAKYNIDRLVYVEFFGYARSAIRREEEMEGLESRAQNCIDREG